jgi:hypothetical protein
VTNGGREGLFKVKHFLLKSADTAYFHISPEKKHAHNFVRHKKLYLLTITGKTSGKHIINNMIT